MRSNEHFATVGSNAFPASSAELTHHILLAWQRHKMPVISISTDKHIIRFLIGEPLGRRGKRGWSVHGISSLSLNFLQLTNAGHNSVTTVEAIEK
ncbi:hypothetical protein BaRGS_00010506 [Batillaria attramentaria]|uniref:Uncharacterized protein n=1 Tax=Batillaria attramentaria TaxID=370345 RepID=A0ABD0LFV7_9CAEN